MKMHYMGSFDGKVANLPRAAAVPEAEVLREHGKPRDLVRKANIGAAVLFAVVLVLMILRAGTHAFHFGGVIAAAVLVIPRELLRALCYRGDTVFYLRFQQSMPFLTGPEHQSRARFLLATLLPDLIFGVIPLVLFFIWPDLNWLGTLGLVCLPMGFGDYMLASLVLRQIPRGAMLYRQIFHTYWYLPA